MLWTAVFSVMLIIMVEEILLMASALTWWQVNPALEDEIAAGHMTAREVDGVKHI